MFFSQTHFCGVKSVNTGTEEPLSSSAQLKTSRGLDCVQQLVPHQVLVAELRKLEQVHASAGGGQTVQISAAVVNAEGRVELLRAKNALLIST